MKTKIIVAVLLAFGLVVGLSLKNKTVNNNPQNSRAETKQSLVAVLNTDVFKKSSDESDFKKIDKEAETKNGDEIKTSSMGRASILYPNGTITNLGKNSDIKIAYIQDNGNKSVLKATGGSIWSKVQKGIDRESSYEIKTKNMVASVRGTVFAIEIKNNKVFIFVFENKVIVIPINPKTGEKLNDKAIEVFSGEKTLVDDDSILRGEILIKNKITREDLSIDIIKDNIDGSLDLDDVKNILDNLSIKSKTTTTATPKIIPKVSSMPSPVPSPSILPTKSSLITITPTPITETQQNTPVPTPTPIPTPTPKPPLKISSVTPSVIDKPQEKTDFIINGEGFSNVKQVLLNETSSSFFVSDTFTIFATVTPEINSGTYDVSVVLSSGQKTTLPRSLTIK